MNSLVPFEDFVLKGLTNKQFLSAYTKCIQLCFEVIEKHGIDVPFVDLMTENFHSVLEGGGITALPFHRINDQRIWSIQFHLGRSVHHLFALVHDQFHSLATYGELAIKEPAFCLYYAGYSAVVERRSLSERLNQNFQINTFTNITEAEAIVVNILKDELELT